MTLHEAEIIFGEPHRHWTSAMRVEFAKALEVKDLDDSTKEFLKDGYIPGFGVAPLLEYCIPSVYLTVTAES